MLSGVLDATDLGVYMDEVKLLVQVEGQDVEGWGSSTRPEGIPLARLDKHAPSSFRSYSSA